MADPDRFLVSSDNCQVLTSLSPPSTKAVDADGSVTSSGTCSM